MSCSKREIAELLPEMVAGNLLQEDAARVQEHLYSCGVCGVEYAALTCVAAIDVPEPEAGFWEEMPNEVMRRIGDERASRGSGPGLKLPGFKWAGGFAAASLAAAALLFFLVRGINNGQPGQQDQYVPAVSVAMGVEAELLEDDIYEIAELSEVLGLDDAAFTEDGLVTITSASYIEGMDYLDINEEALKLFESDLGQIPKSG